MGDYGPPAGSLPCPDDKALLLAQTATRLKAMDAPLQERLINWGYAICDAGMRKWVEPDAARARRLPVSRGRRRLKSAATCQSTGSQLRGPSFGTCACSRSTPA